jgi:hypothetical protein
MEIQMIKFLKQKSYQLAIGVASLTLATSASAAIDVAGVVSTIGEGDAAVAAIGGAVLTVWAIRKVYSLIAR